jgi:NDP-sugar pyrophosphorylase family protein
MKTFIFADRADSGLEPLTRNTCAALLPVAGKAVIEYTIEDLARAGIRQAVIVACAHADRVEAHLGKGERWGMAFDYFPSRGGEHPASLLRRYAKDIREPVLLVRGDVMRSSIAGYIGTAACEGGPLIEARIDGAATGVCLCRAGVAKLDTLDWPYAGSPGEAIPARTLDPQDATWSALDSLAAYHRTNLDVAADRYPGLKLAGWARESGLTVGRGSHVETPSLTGEHAFVGRGSRVHPEARLGGTSVVSDSCFIDSQASITDSVILPGTYVGENIDIRNAIVNGNQVIRVDSGASYRVADRFLLTQMQHQGSTLPARLANRTAGLALLLLSLPLWPIAATSALLNSPSAPLRTLRLRRMATHPVDTAGALLNSPSAPLRTLRLRSNKYRLDEKNEAVRGEFTGYEWAVSAPVLRRLPLLLAVIAGHINLVGTRPRPLETTPAGGTPWEDIAGDAPAGLLGPVQLDLPDDAPSEEGLLNEIYYAQYRSLKSDLGYLLKGLRAMFTGRAWAAHGQAGNP